MSDRAVASAPESAGASRATDDTIDHEVIVIGAGVAGIYQIKRLVDLGVDAVVLEGNADLGGTWYQNRYPGARFDSESFTYGYSFSQELLEEWHWTEMFSPQPETLKYLQHVVDKFDLRRHMRFDCKVEAMTFDEERDTWTLRLVDGQELRCHVVITAIGVLSIPTMPSIEGMETFEGPSFHPFHWPHEPTELAGKRVAVIGTGATAIQIIPEVAKEAEHLTVFQRRPNWAAPLNNRPISEEEDGGDPGPLRRDLRRLLPQPGGLRARARSPGLGQRPTGGAAGAVGPPLRRSGVRDLAAELRRDLHG